MPKGEIKIKKRIFAILMIFTVLIFVLIIRVGWIQFVKGEEYQRKAFKQQTQNITIPPRRGTIYDTNGKELAISASVETVGVNPQEFKKDKTQEELAVLTDKVAQDLSEILDIDKDDVIKKLTANTRGEHIKRKIDKELGTKVRKYISDNEIKGLWVYEDSKRYYPNNNLASHIIGFTGDENQGLEGIEAIMDSYLKGSPGKILSEVDARGREVPFNKEYRIDAIDGYNVVLTIDATIQHFVEKALDQAVIDHGLKDGAAAVVMNPNTGEILALASRPDYNPNIPFAQPTLTYWDDWQKGGVEEVEYLQSTIWRNKAVADTYEPGSTFKAFTYASAIEENLIDLNAGTVCSPVTLQGWTINCWLNGGHGAEDYRHALYNSCNPVMVKVAQQLGIDRFYSYAKAFGFYEPTKLGIPGEAKGIFHPDPKEIDMAVASFGQRFVVTPIEIITAYAAIANGGDLLKPKIVKEITDQDGNIIKSFDTEIVRQVISNDTSKIMRELLEGVVAEGTGKKAYVRGYRVAGKTGTSETKEDGHYIASFSAFAPANKPEICVLVVLDNPTGVYYGGQIAAPIAGSLAEEILNYMEIERQYTDKDKELMMQEVYVPEVRGITLKEAKEKIELSKLKFVVEGDGYDNETVIFEQMPKPDASIPEQSTIILYTYEPEEEITVEMPNILNKTITEATETLRQVGLNIKVTGLGIAVEQNFEIGSRVKKGEIVNVVFDTLVTD